MARRPRVVQHVMRVPGEQVATSVTIGGTNEDVVVDDFEPVVPEPNEVVNSALISSGWPDRLSAVRADAESLARATDSMNIGFSEVESALVGLKMGMQAYANLPDIDGYGDEFPTPMLAFRKHEGRWCLVVDRYEADHTSLASTTPITKDSRAMRIAAADAIPALIDDLLTRVSEQSREIEERAIALVGIAAQLRDTKS